MSEAAHTVRRMDESTPRRWIDQLQPLIRPVSQTQWAIDSVAGLLFLAGSGLFLFRTLDGPADVILTGITILLMAAALMTSRVSPPIALTTAWVGALFQMATGQSPMFANTAIFVVLFATAAYGSRLVYWAGFVSTALGAVAITLYLAAPYYGVTLRDGVLNALLSFFAALFALALSWTAGALFRSVVRGRQVRIAQRAAEARAATEEERGRIARDMHDVVAHSLAVVIAQADGARYAAAADPEAATRALTTISQTSRAALSDVRLLLTQLRHSQFGESQQVGPQPSLADLEQLYAQVRAAGVDLRVDVDPAPVGTPPTTVQLAVYRILQEGLTNTLRHGDGGPVDVGLSWLPDRVGLEIRNGIRADGRPSDGGGHGLIGMRERAQLVGGQLLAAPEGGTFVVRATLPIQAGDDRIDG